MDVDASKEEGEISEDDDVQVVSFTKNGANSHVSEPAKSEIQCENRKNNNMPEKKLSEPRDILRTGLYNSSRTERLRRGKGYGLSASVTRARERLKKIPAQTIPDLMSLDTTAASKFSTGKSNVAPLPSNNWSGISVPGTPVSNSVPSSLPTQSSQRSQNSFLSKLRKKRLKGKPALQLGSKSLYESHANSPSSDLSEIDYVDMLLEYKEIQKQLEEINEEQGRLFEKEKNKENLDQGELKNFTDEKHNSVVECKTEQAQQTVEEEDDLDILLLRQRCLESLAAVTGEKTPEQDRTNSQKSRRVSSYRRNRSPVSRRQSFLTSRENASSVRSRRRTRTSTVKEREQSPVFNQNRKRLRDTENEEFIRTSVRSLNSEEDFKKFLQSRVSKSEISDNVKKKKPFGHLSSALDDNYDQVSMDLDSSTEDAENSATGATERVYADLKVTEFDMTVESQPWKWAGTVPFQSGFSGHGDHGAICLPDLKVTFPGAMPVGRIPFTTLPSQPFAHPDVGAVTGDMRFNLGAGGMGRSGGPAMYHPGEGLLPLPPVTLQVPATCDYYVPQNPTQMQSVLPPGGVTWQRNAGASLVGVVKPVVSGGSIPSAFSTESRVATEGTVSGLSDSSAEDSNDSEELRLRNLLLIDLAKKKSQPKPSVSEPENVDSEKSLDERLLQLANCPLPKKPAVRPLMTIGACPPQRPTVKPLMELAAGPVPKQLPNASKWSVDVPVHKSVTVILPTVQGHAQTSSNQSSAVPFVPQKAVMQSSRSNSPAAIPGRTVMALSSPSSASESNSVAPVHSKSNIKVTVHAAAVPPSHLPPPWKMKTKPKVPMPQHKPVIISFSGDTDSEEEISSELEEKAGGLVAPQQVSSVAVRGNSLLGNLDSLLREARQAAEVVAKDAKSDKSNSTRSSETMGSKNTLPKPDAESETDSMSSSSNVTQHSSNPTQEKLPVGAKKVVKASNLNSAAGETSVSSAPTDSSNHPQLTVKSLSLGLDSWLVDGRKVELKLLARKIGQLEKEINAEKSHLQQEERQLGSVELEMTRKRGQYRQSVIRVQKLKEQLTATEKIVEHNQKQIVVLSKKTQDLKNQTEKRKSRLEDLKKEMKEAGRRLYNGNPLPKPSSTSLMQRTLSVNNLGASSSDKESDTKNQNLSSSQNTPSKPAVPSASSMAAEKKRLEELAKKIEEMIKLHKKKQAAKTKSRRLSVKHEAKGRESVSQSMEHIATEEKMVFGADGDSQLTDFIAKRRRSLLDEKPGSTKPVFQVETRLTDGTMNSADEAKEAGVVEDEKKLLNSSDDDGRFGAIQQMAEGRLRQVRKVLSEHLRKQVADDADSGPDATLIGNSDPYLKFQCPVKKISISLENFPKETQKTVPASSHKPYRSSLLCFRSYRFSPYYRTKEGLAVHSSAHKVNAHLKMCHFDLMGKCNDDKCPWQHEHDFKASHKETLMDLASYVPSVAGINDSTPVREQQGQISEFVDEFIKKNSKLTEAQRSLLLLMETNNQRGTAPSHYVTTEPRKWTLSSTARATPDSDDERDKSFVPDRNTENAIVNEDDIILDLDFRYWMLETQEAEDIETAVSENPSDTQLWLKLAYKKMSECKSKSDETLAVGLHVLSRALEANQNNETLWRHYLHLFGKREDRSELRSFYQMALDNAPSYYLYWKYLELSSSYSEKMEICKDIRRFLCSPRCHDDREKRSHHLLEIILCQAGLSVETGRFKTGREVIESVVKSRISVIWLNLVWKDRILIWLAYIHLISFRKLPMQLYDPADGLPGRIVNKVPFSISWSNDTKPRLSIDHLTHLTDDALQSCANSICEDATSSEWLGEIYRLKLRLEQKTNGEEAAETLCRQMLENFPHFEFLWICLIDLKRASGDDASLQEVIAEALQQNPTSVRLHLAGISVSLSQDDQDGALEFAENCALSLFDVDQCDSAPDPNLLYCKLLDQTLPCTYNPPPLFQGITEEWVTNNRADIWLCYCLLLDLQGAHDQASEVYQTAISTIKDASDLGRFCLRFLRRCYDTLAAEISSSNPPDVSKASVMQAWSTFDRHVSQVLRIIPSKFPLPHDPDQSWVSYLVQNQIVDFYVSCLSDDETILKSFERFLKQMSTNVALVKRACDFLMQQGHTVLCNGYCTEALLGKPKAIQLWNVKLHLSHQEGNVNQTRKVFQTATSNVPFSQKLWKDFMLFELVQRNSDAVQWIVQKCRELHINVEEALKAVVSSRN